MNATWLRNLTAIGAAVASAIAFALPSQAADSVTKTYVAPTGDAIVIPFIPPSPSLSCASTTHGIGGDCFEVGPGTINIDITDASGMAPIANIKFFDDSSAAVGDRIYFCGAVHNVAVPDGATHFNLWIGVVGDQKACTGKQVAPGTEGTVTASGSGIASAGSAAVAPVARRVVDYAGPVARRGAAVHRLWSAGSPVRRTAHRVEL